MLQQIKSVSFSTLGGRIKSIHFSFSEVTGSLMAGLCTLHAPLLVPGPAILGAAQGALDTRQL